MRHVTQPDKKTCGQTCVAMIAGVTVEEVIRKMRRRGATRPEHLIKALRGYGFAIKQDRSRRGAPRGERAICRLRFRDSDGAWHGHLVIKWDGRWYDPAGVNFQHKVPWKIASHIRLD